MTPAAYLPSSVKNAGLTDASVTVVLALVPAGVVTATLTVPAAASSGACTLICVGLM
jgi:hypothetical protein